MDYSSISEVKGDLIEIKYIPLSSLQNLSDILMSGNPKKHDLDLISTSIIQNGFIDPPKWDKNLNGGRGGIVYGNGRLEALTQTLVKLKKGGKQPPRGIGISADGEWCVPIKFGVDAESELAAKRLAIDHNNLTLSEFNTLETQRIYDERLYAEILQELNDNNQLPLTIDPDYLEELLQVLDNSDGGGSDNEEEELPPAFNVEPRCSLGEIWVLGEHRLFCGDSCEEENILRLFNGRNPDLVWSDPPYGIRCQKKDGKIGAGTKGFAAKSYPVIHGDDTTGIAANSFQICQELFPEVPQIWWGANHYSEFLPSSPCWIVWDKNNGEADFADCELAWTNQKSAVRKFLWTWNGMVKQGEAANEKRVHPNQKPIEMVNWFWDKYCDGTLCFDPFLGSGTSLIAAQKTNRVVYGFEIMPEYCEVILQRWESVSGEKARLEV